MTKYIIRLDDACPTMNVEKWSEIENILDKYNIKPIVAVIPNNKDKSMEIDKYDISFWDKVRNWQQKGWYIALHGYEHLYETNEQGLVPFNKNSEFAGLDYEIQSKKIKLAWDIFQKENIKSNIWVAPSHSFDLNTLKALKNYTDIEIVSDGIAIFPFLKYKFKWIPQQVWKFRKMPFGVWTGCFHPNMMTDIEINELEKFIKENINNFHFNLQDLYYSKFSFVNFVFEKIYWILKKIK